MHENTCLCCVPLCILTVCSLTCVYLSAHLPMFTCVCLCPPVSFHLFVLTCHCIPVCVHLPVFACVHLSVRTCPWLPVCSPMFTHVHLSVPVFTYMCSPVCPTCLFSCHCSPICVQLSVYLSMITCVCCAVLHTVHAEGQRWLLQAHVLRHRKPSLHGNHTQPGLRQQVRLLLEVRVSNLWQELQQVSVL